MLGLSAKLANLGVLGINRRNAEYTLIYNSRRLYPLVDNKLRTMRRLLTPQGTYVMVSGPKGRWLGPVPRMVRGMAMFALGDRRFAWFVAKSLHEDLAYLGELMATGKVTPVIERTYPLAEAADALAYLGEGHSRGKTVITVAATTDTEGV